MIWIDAPSLSEPEIAASELMAACHDAFLAQKKNRKRELEMARPRGLAPLLLP
jgi:hypothetical protein